MQASYGVENYDWDRPVVALGLRELCAKYLGGPFLCGARKNFPASSMRKCNSNMFRVHQYSNCCQCQKLMFRCTRGTFSIQTWHGLVEQLKCIDLYW